MRTAFRAAFFVLPCALAAACGEGQGDARASTDSAQVRDSARLIYGATGADNVRVVPVEIEIVGLPAGWEGMKIAALSDFHLGQWAGNTATARAAVERAVAERPDVFVLLGDYVSRGADYAALDQVLAPLRGKPVFAVMGDRDMLERTEGEPDSTAIRTREALRRNGVQLLENRRAPFVRRGDTAFIGGIDPYTARRPDWRRAEIFGGIPGGRTPVLLAHMPVAAVTLPTDRYRAMLAGHTFCGQIEVPGTPRLTWLNTEVFPGTPNPASTRIYRVRGATVFVTCGLGFGYVPVRFGAAPEVAMITLRGVGGTEETDSAQAPAGVNVDSLIQSFTPDTAAARRRAEADSADEQG